MHVSCGTETPGFEHASGPLCGRQQPRLLRFPTRTGQTVKLRSERISTRTSNQLQSRRGPVTLAAADRGITGDPGSTREATAATNNSLGSAGSTGSVGSASSYHTPLETGHNKSSSGLAAPRGSSKAKVSESCSPTRVMWVNCQVAKSAALLQLVDGINLPDQATACSAAFGMARRPCRYNSRTIPLPSWC